jgi:AcrR family transcriptional regulator
MRTVIFRRVAEREPQAAKASPGLRRLPPGRHGLPRELVARNQRDRLVAGTIAAVAEGGYRETTVGQISAAAGVSRRTFYVHFETKQDCVLASLGVIAEHLRSEAAASAADQPDWPSRVVARLRAALAVFAANPQLARFALAVPRQAGGEIAARQRQALDRALAELTDGMPPRTAAQAPSPEVQQALIGGALALILERVEAVDDRRSGSGEGIEDLAPELSELFLSPFVGRAEAARAAATA